MRISLIILFLLSVLPACGQSGSTTSIETKADTTINLATYQPKDPASYPKGYFRNPLNIPIFLAGNFGECRPGHFHSGLDIKTQGRENLPVFAAADGYISRIKTSSGGFGHALYINHPNGYTTLYAHLNDFTPEVQQYLRQEQYKQQRWDVDLTLDEQQFPVRKGQQIAWSGNTGGSTAPHLHFEIRDTRTEHPLNPLLFGFDIKDNIAPKPLRLFFYDLSPGKTIYNQAPLVKDVTNSGNKYRLKDTIVLQGPGRFGAAVEVNDFMDDSQNTLNFYTASWWLDGSPVGAIRLDDIGYDVTRYLHAYVDYGQMIAQKRYAQLLFRQPGNLLQHVYESLDDDGAFQLNDETAHELRLMLTDALGNESEVVAWVRKTPATAVNTACEQLFTVGKSNNFQHPNVQFQLSNDALYDDICFTFSQSPKNSAFSDRFKLLRPTVPVHSYFALSLKPNKAVPFDLRQKMVLRYSDGSKTNGQAAKFENGWYIARVRNFGDYWLEADTTAPVITPVAGRKGRVTFRITDSQTSVAWAEAKLNGKWVVLEQHGPLWFYEIDGNAAGGKNTLLIRARDESGNEKSLSHAFVK